MITEDYVSFEIAKLLKEKGFDEPCLFIYEETILTSVASLDIHLSEGEGELVEELTNSRFVEEENRVCAPTHQTAMKWLREVHEWSIQVFPVFEKKQWCYDVYKIGIKLFDQADHMSAVDYDKYEEAVEAALKYCLEHLI